VNRREAASLPECSDVICVCVAFSGIVGRWWTLALPIGLVVAVFALSPVDAVYQTFARRPSSRCGVWRGSPDAAGHTLADRRDDAWLRRCSRMTPTEDASGGGNQVRVRVK
jgi:hypothetical protein